MRHYGFHEKLADGVMYYTRVSKTEAKKRFLQGESITFTPCNTSPASPIYRLSISMCLDRKDDNTITDLEYWDRLVNSYTFYNCGNELGRYIAYYTEEFKYAGN